MAGLGILFAGNALAFGESPTVFGTPSRFKPISENHTNYGVSQLLVGAVGSTFSSNQFGLNNPGDVTMRTVIFVYSRAVQDVADFAGSYRDDFSLAGDANDNPEEYLGCVTMQFTPHASISLDEDALEEAIDPFCPGGIGSDCRIYVEALSVPEQKVDITAQQWPQPPKTRKADGLGLARWGWSGYGGRSGLQLVHPSLWKLPHNTTANPQARNSAINGMCAVALDVGDPLMWNEFGVFCTGGPLGLNQGAQEFCTP